MKAIELRGVGLVAAVLCWTLATGCGGLRQAQRYRSLNNEIAATRPARVLEASVLKPEELMTAQRLVTEVLRRNPSLEAASHAAAAAAARYPQVVAFDDPMLGFSTAPNTWRSQIASPGHRIDLKQRLPFPGKRFLRGEAALAEARAAQHSFEDVRLRLAWRAWVLYHDHVFVRQALEINQSHTELVTEFQRIAKARYAAGKGSLQGPLQADVGLAHLEHQRVVLESRREITRAEINALLHREPQLGLPSFDVAGSAPPILMDSVEHLMRTALKNHPDAAADAQVIVARQARLRSARRDFFPDAALGGAYNTMWQNPEHWWMASVSLNLPIQIRRRLAAVDQASAELRRTEAIRAATADRIRLDVMRANTRLKEAHHVVRFFSDRVLPSARASVAAARTEFESGRSNFLALIDAQRGLLADELGYAEALSALRQRQGDLARATGDLATLQGEGETR